MVRRSLLDSMLASNLVHDFIKSPRYQHRLIRMRSSALVIYLTSRRGRLPILLLTTNDVVTPLDQTIYLHILRKNQF